MGEKKTESNSAGTDWEPLRGRRWHEEDARAGLAAARSSGMPLKMCPEIYRGPSLRRRGSLRKSSHTPKYAPVFGAPRSLQPGLLATISGHILSRFAREHGIEESLGIGLD
jgi:hypothetical protein